MAIHSTARSAFELLAAMFALTASVSAQEGPKHGTLVISGGAEKPGIILERFIQLAGGPDAPIIVVPTSGNADTYDQSYTGLKRFRDAGARNLFVLHTRDRAVANSDQFVKPMTTAKGIWFEGGEHWKHADAYLDTKVHKEVLALLDGLRGESLFGTDLDIWRQRLLASSWVRDASTGWSRWRRRSAPGPWHWT